MFRLVFNSVGVRVGVVIRSVELNDLVKTASGSAYDSVEYDQVKTGSSELKQEETEELSQSQIVGTLAYPSSATAYDSDCGFH